jgi:hypothetical protein
MKSSLFIFITFITGFKQKNSFIKIIFCLILVVNLLTERLVYSNPSGLVSKSSQIEGYLDTLARDTYNCITAMVEPSTGLPHDRLDGSLLDIIPQFAIIRDTMIIAKSENATLKYWRSQDVECIYNGNYGLKIEYDMPSGNWGSLNIERHYSFNVSDATYIQFWAKGAQGGERFEIVLWSDRQGAFPGRPPSAEIALSTNWELKRIPLDDFKLEPYNIDLTSIERLSIGFNDGMHAGGTIYFDEIAFVDSAGNNIHIQLDEETSVTNIGLYISSVVAAIDLKLEEYDNAVSKLSTTLTSVESLSKWHGFPQTHNSVVSLKPSDGDTTICTIDLGNFAAGLIILRQRISELANRADALLNQMEWDWLYDTNIDLLFGGRFPDGNVTNYHCDWLCSDSRLAQFIAIGTEKIPYISWYNLKRDHEQPKCVDSTLWHYEPGWDGGGVFMSFLPAIFLNECDSLYISAHNFVLDQIYYYNQIGAPAWGWSATALPLFGTDYGGWGYFNDSILVPHACLLAVNSVGIDTVYENLQSFETLGAKQSITNGIQSFDFGFRSSVNWQTVEVATVYLVLDQCMSFLSLVNYLRDGDGIIRRLFCQDTITQRAIELIPDYCISCPPPDNIINRVNNPVIFHVCQNYPNPFNPSTKISYSISNSNLVILKIYDILGREIQSLVNKYQTSGSYTINFNAKNLSSGIYFYKLQVGRDYIQIKKMILMH